MATLRGSYPAFRVPSIPTPFQSTNPAQATSAYMTTQTAKLPINPRLSAAKESGVVVVLPQVLKAKPRAVANLEAGSIILAAIIASKLLRI